MKEGQKLKQNKYLGYNISHHNRWWPKTKERIAYNWLQKQTFDIFSHLQCISQDFKTGKEFSAFDRFSRTSGKSFLILAVSTVVSPLCVHLFEVMEAAIHQIVVYNHTDTGGAPQ